MWIFTQAGLVSIVEDMNNKNRLVVRARERGTLETLMPEYIKLIQNTPSADYHFKVFLDRDVVANFVKIWTQEIDYTNFKGSIKDYEYHKILLSIWSIFRNYVVRKNRRPELQDNNKPRIFFWENTPPKKEKK